MTLECPVSMVFPAPWLVGSGRLAAGTLPVAKAAHAKA